MTCSVEVDWVCRLVPTRPVISGINWEPTMPLADVLAPDEFSLLQESSVDRRFQYLGRCRQVRVGSFVNVVFENHQTMWFRFQELEQVARAAPGSVKTELDWYSKLLPDGHSLRAAVWVGEPGRRPSRELENLRLAVASGRIGLCSEEGVEVLGTFRPDRVADRLIGLAGWAEFRFSREDRARFADTRHIWRLFIEAENYCHTSEPLTPFVQASLLEDLKG